MAEAGRSAAGEDLYAAAGIRVRADESEIPVANTMSSVASPESSVGRMLGHFTPGGIKV